MKIIVMQVPDTHHEDNMTMAIAVWNSENPDRKIDVKMQTSFYAVEDDKPSKRKAAK